MTSEGIPFLQAGEEMLRTKVKADGSFDENSYASSDAVNCLKWNDLDKAEYQQVFEYYKTFHLPSGSVTSAELLFELKITKSESAVSPFTPPLIWKRLCALL